jgi:hypothetical protein
MYCTYHEYRVAVGLMGLLGFITGLTDALVYDWTLKSFLWAGEVVFIMWLVSIEFLSMPRPDEYVRQATEFTVVGLSGLLSCHHMTWVIITLMQGVEIEDKLWLAPNIYVDFVIYTLIMVSLLMIYVTYLMYATVNSCKEQRVEKKIRFIPFL